MIKSISFIGAGNVSTHFAKAFFKAGIQIDTILSRKAYSAKRLSKQVNAKASTSFNRLDKHSDLYIVAVPDDAIQEVLRDLEKVLDHTAYVVHTSGATDTSSIKTNFDNIGFVWPPQSLSKNREIDFSKVPLCYGASSQNMTTALKQLLKQVSQNLQQLDSDQKLALHLAAVFANNFTNHMYHIAYELCQQHNLDFGSLYPIILESAQKVIGNHPANMQTGPAIRHDTSSLQKHKRLLSENKEYQKIYSLLSNSIQNHKSNK